MPELLVPAYRLERPGGKVFVVNEAKVVTSWFMIQGDTVRDIGMIKVFVKSRKNEQLIDRFRPITCITRDMTADEQSAAVVAYLRAAVQKPSSELDYFSCRETF